MKTLVPTLRICCLLLFCHIVALKNYAQTTLPKYGITLCGAEFGENNLPGIINVDYTYPTTTDIDYFVAKGVNLIQLPIKWERVQRSLGGELDPQEISFISKFIDDCNERNIKVTLVLQNFGKYRKDGADIIVGESEATASHLVNLWTKIAKEFLPKNNIYAYSLMAEPSNMLSSVWAKTIQKVISSIRVIDTKTILLIEGNNYSNAATWVEYNDELKNLQDPANKLLFNAHCYFDKDFSGRYKTNYDEDGATECTGVERVMPFINWLKENNLNGFIGEFGVPKNSKQWMQVMNNFLEYIHDNNLGACYWAAGQWWKDYPLSIQPENYNDQPQLIIFEQYFDKNKDISNPKTQQIWTRSIKHKNLTSHFIGTI